MGPLGYTEVDPGHLGYALKLYGQSSQWSATYASIWGRLLATFRPAANSPSTGG